MLSSLWFVPKELHQLWEQGVHLDLQGLDQQPESQRSQGISAVVQAGVLATSASLIRAEARQFRHFWVGDARGFGHDIPPAALVLLGRTDALLRPESG